MSTRAIVIVTGESKFDGPETIRIYRHDNGNPTSTFSDIDKTLEKCLSKVNEYNKKSFSLTRTIDSIHPKFFTDVFIGESAHLWGSGARIDDDYEIDDPQCLSIWGEKFIAKKHMGNQADLQWIYVVDLKKSRIGVYGGKYTDQVPYRHFIKGVVDPIIYADQLTEKYQDIERTRIYSLMQSITDKGFEFKKSRKPKKQDRA